MHQDMGGWFGMVLCWSLSSLGKVPVLKNKLVRNSEFRNTQKHLIRIKSCDLLQKKHEHDNMYQQMNIKMMIISSKKADT